MLSREPPGGGAAEAISPDEVVDESVGPEAIIEEDPDAVARPPVEVDEEAGRAAERRDGGVESRGEPVEIRVEIGPAVVESAGVGWKNENAWGYSKRLRNQWLDGFCSVPIAAASERSRL